MIDGFRAFTTDLTKALPSLERDQEIQNKVATYVAAHPSLEGSPISVALAQKVARGEIPYSKEEFEKFQMDFIRTCLEKVQSAPHPDAQTWNWLTKKISRLQPFQWKEIEETSQFAELARVLKDPDLFVQHVQMLIRTGNTRYLQDPRIVCMLKPSLLEALAESCLQKIREKPSSAFWAYIVDELVQMPSLEYLLFFTSMVDLEEDSAQEALRRHIAKGPLQMLGLSLTWDPAIALWKHEEAKEDLESLYQSLSHLPVSECLEQMQEMTSYWYQSLFAKNPPSQDIYQNYLAFKCTFQEMYFSLREDILHINGHNAYLSRAEKAYREKDVAALQAIRKEIQAPEEEMQLFRLYLQQEERFPLLHHFFTSQGITLSWLEEGSSWDQKKALSFAYSLLGKFLAKEGIVLDDRPKENLYERIEASLQKVIYKKFLFCINLLEKKHPGNPLLQQLRDMITSTVPLQEVSRALELPQGSVLALQDNDGTVSI